MGGSQCGDAASHPTTACIGPQRYEKSGKSTLFGTISHPAASKSARRAQGRRGGTRLRCGRRGGTRLRCGEVVGRQTGAGRTEAGRAAGQRRSGVSRAGRTSGRAHDGGQRTGRRGGGPDGGVADRTEGWMGGPAARFSGPLSGRHAVRATRAGRRPANRPPRPGAPHPAAGCAGWSGCRTGRPAPRTRRRCGRGGG